MLDNNKIVKERWQAIKLTIKCWKLIQKYSSWYLVYTGIIVIWEGGMPSLLIVILQKIINFLQENQCSIKELILWVCSYVGLNLLSICTSQIYTLYTAKFSLKFEKNLRNDMLKKVSELQLRDFEDPEIYNIINRAQEQSGTSILNFTKNIFNGIKSIITLFSVLLILIQFPNEWILFIFLMPLIKCICTICLNWKWYEIRTKRTLQERQSWYIEFLMTTGNAFKEIRLFGLEKYLIDKYNALKEMVIGQEIEMNNKQFFLQIITESINAIINGGAFMFIIYQGYIKTILIGDVTAYINSINTVKNNIEIFFETISQINHELLYINWIFQFLNLKVPDIQGDVSINEIKEIEFKNVSFRYGSDKNYVLKDVNLVLKKGKMIALVGENGSGKSTLIKLLLGFYEDYEGEILINGIELSRLNKENYMNKISGVFQDYVKYEATLRENVCFGNLDSLKCDDKIWEILCKLKLDSIFLKEDGLDVMLGNWFGKKQLSIGEWQRVAIARGVFRESDVYILDEPDASLDVIKQAETLSLYEDALSKAITVFISHKLNYIHTFCNELIVLRQGKIIEQGSYNELMEKKGQYYKMFKKYEGLRKK